VPLYGGIHIIIADYYYGSKGYKKKPEQVYLWMSFEVVFWIILLFLSDELFSPFILPYSFWLIGYLG
jgi:hypothetical protein